MRAHNSASGLHVTAARIHAIAGKVTGQPIHKLIGGAHRTSVPCYGYGMMLRDEPVEALATRFVDEAAAIKDAGFVATKMKVGFGPKPDVALCEAVRL